MTSGLRSRSVFYLLSLLPANNKPLPRAPIGRSKRQAKL
uniref:Uncharacterized protein n=1 Tax=Vibrio tasmaniensis TaxID=212663 RepID=A0A0H3ZJ14_9VIBR|nr:hypothetical protein [Vibrio tasmaniensis]